MFYHSSRLIITRQSSITTKATARIVTASPIVRGYSQLSTTTRTRPVVHSRKMASIIQATAATAHSAFASLASASPIKAGDKIPDVEVKEAVGGSLNFSKLPGKNILVLVPGAFSPTCSSQVPSYMALYQDFTSKGVKDIFVVTVNDTFVVKAWKKDMQQESGDPSNLRFAADDAGKLAGALGLVLDAQDVFGGPRLQRGAIVIEDGVVKSVVVEPNPGAVTVSDATEVIKTL